VIYQDPLAYLLGLEGIALLDSWAGDHDREFTEARLAEIRRLLADEKLRDRGCSSSVSAPLPHTSSSPKVMTRGGRRTGRNRRAGRGRIPARPARGVALDAACGTGRFAEFLAQRGHQVIGVDSSPDMLAHARRRVPAARFTSPS